MIMMIILVITVTMISIVIITITYDDDNDFIKASPRSYYVGHKNSAIKILRVSRYFLTSNLKKKKNENRTTP